MPYKGEIPALTGETVYTAWENRTRMALLWAALLHGVWVLSEGQNTALHLESVVCY